MGYVRRPKVVPPLPDDWCDVLFALGDAHRNAAADAYRECGNSPNFSKHHQVYLGLSKLLSLIADAPELPGETT